MACRRTRLLISERTRSSFSNAATGTPSGNLDRNLFNDLVETVPLVQSLIDRKANTSFTRRGSMIYTKTPSREALSKKIKLADKQSALEMLQWEAMTSNTRAEKFQEDVTTMQAEMSSFMILCEGLRKNALSGEDYDVTMYHSDHIPDIDCLDEMEWQKMEAAQEAYIAAAKEYQDEESIAAPRSARFTSSIVCVDIKICLLAQSPNNEQ